MPLKVACARSPWYLLVTQSVHGFSCERDEVCDEIVSGFCLSLNWRNSSDVHRDVLCSSSISISRSSGAGKSLQVSFAKPLCTSTQWANLRKRGSVHPRQCVAPQVF